MASTSSSLFIFTPTMSKGFSTLTIIDNVITFYFDGIDDDACDLFGDGLFFLKALSKDLADKPVIDNTDGRHISILHNSYAPESSPHCHYQLKESVNAENLQNILTLLAGYIHPTDAASLLSLFLVYHADIKESKSWSFFSPSISCEEGKTTKETERKPVVFS